MMTLADFLKDVLNHDTSKQLLIDVSGMGFFTNITVDEAGSDGTTLRLDVSR